MNGWGTLETIERWIPSAFLQNLSTIRCRRRTLGRRSQHHVHRHAPRGRGRRHRHRHVHAREVKDEAVVFTVRLTRAAPHPTPPPKDPHT